MVRLGVLGLFLACLLPGGVKAQVVECPGFLPSARLDEARQTALTRKQLRRFIALLDLHDIEAIDENTIMAMYADHPEQLAIKLSYLSLQCQMVVLDSAMTARDRQKAVRSVFLDYALMPPQKDIDDLTAYVNQITSNAQYQALEPLVASIEQALERSQRRQWQQRWFPKDGATSGPHDPASKRWSVIVSSPRYEDEGWAELIRHQRDWPDAYFELDGPFDLESPFYAVVAGRGLPADVADELLQVIRTKGMAKDAYRWKAPFGKDAATSAEPETEPRIEFFRPTPPRPLTNAARAGDARSLSQ